MVRELDESDKISFSVERSGELRIRDELSGGCFTVQVDGSPTLAPAKSDWFVFPVDAAVWVETSTIAFPKTLSSVLRDADGEFIGALSQGSWPLDGRETFLEINGALKTYAYFENQAGTENARISLTGDGGTKVTFEEPVRFVLGVRSRHERPAETITVPDNPHAVRQVLPYLAGAVKEWSAERSWPTLRGHPPRLEVGDVLHIPSSLSKPDTGVEIACPPRLESLYRVAPLVYYLGADVVDGDVPELRLRGGYTESLGTGADLESSVDRLLAHCFILDSLVRGEGYVSLPRYEYDELAPQLPFYPPELDALSIPEQLLEYLEVPHESLTEAIPEWPLTGVLQPTIDDAEHLPHLLNRLARVHVDSGDEAADDADDSVLTGVTQSPVSEGQTALSKTGWRTALEFELDEAQGASVVMIGEAGLPGVFARTDWEAFGVEAPHPTLERREAVSRSELRSLLEADHLYVHFGNEVTADGFSCSDGCLRFADVDDVGAAAVSFSWTAPDVAPAEALIESGAIVAVSFGDGDAGADAERLARYLTLGYPVVESARLAECADVRFAGNASTAIVSSQDGRAPIICDLTSLDRDHHQLSLRYAPTPLYGMGSVAGVWFDHHYDGFQLVGTGVDTPIPVDTETVLDLGPSSTVFRLNGSVHHDGPLTTEAIRRSAEERTRPQ